MASFLVVLANIFNIPVNELASRVPGNIDIQTLLPDFTRQVEHCFTSPGFSDPDLGSFGRETSLSCYMGSPCAPETPKAMQVKFLLYQRNTRQVLVIDHYDSWVTQILRNSRIAVFIPGFITNYLTAPNVNATVYGFMKNMNTDVILVDYFHGAVFRDQAVANVRVIGALLGQLLSDLKLLSRTICSGFSIGAHACGFAGQWLKMHRNQVLPSCIVVDPSGPGFEGCPTELKLSIGDCGVISVLHGSYYPIEGVTFGTREKTGNCDFYVNLGRREPGCPTTDFQAFVAALRNSSTDTAVNALQQVLACDHLRTFELFRLQLKGTGPQNGLLRARLCSSPGDHSPTQAISRFLPPNNVCSSNENINFCLDINSLPQVH